MLLSPSPSRNKCPIGVQLSHIRRMSRSSVGSRLSDDPGPRSTNNLFPRLPLQTVDHSPSSHPSLVCTLSAAIPGKPCTPGRILLWALWGRHSRDGVRDVTPRHDPASGSVLSDELVARACARQGWQIVPCLRRHSRVRDSALTTPRSARGS